MPVLGVVAGHKFVEVGTIERLGFESVVDVGAVVEDPGEIRCLEGEIRCRFIFSGKNDELTLDFPLDFPPMN